MRVKKRAKKRMVPRWVILGGSVLGVFLIACILYQKILQPAGIDLYVYVIGIGGVILTAFVTIFAATLNKSAAFEDSIKRFLRQPICVIVLALMLGSLIMVVYCGVANVLVGSDPSKTPDSDPSVVPEDPTVQEPPVEASDAVAVVSKDPHLSLNAWEKDPFFKDIDQYYGYHVEEPTMVDTVYEIIQNSLSAIDRRGRYSTDALNGADSEYARWTRRANELYEGYTDFLEKNLLPDYQERLLADEIEARKNADGLYQVSDNEKIIGDRYINLGDFYRASDTKCAFGYYVEAFEMFQIAFRTCVAEGGDSATLKLLSNQITNVADKLTVLTGMDSREQVMAPLVAEAFQRVVELNEF